VEQNLGGCEFKVPCEVKKIVARCLGTQDRNCLQQGIEKSFSHDEWLSFVGTNVDK
jgi:hypothetical protein